LKLDEILLTRNDIDVFLFIFRIDDLAILFLVLFIIVIVIVATLFVFVFAGRRPSTRSRILSWSLLQDLDEIHR
jgi:hypothetical protein